MSSDPLQESRLPMSSLVPTVLHSTYGDSVLLPGLVTHSDPERVTRNIDACNHRHGACIRIVVVRSSTFVPR